MNEDDYKYVLQDLRETCIGARYRYDELLSAERVPFKFQTIVDRLILPYADPALTIGEHLLTMTPEDKNYRIYDSLKACVRYYEPKKGGGYAQKKKKLKDFVKDEARKSGELVIQEVIISNLALMGFKL